MRIVTLNCYLALMSFGAVITATGPALKEIQGEVMLTTGELGLFTTALSIGLIIAVLTGGITVDRYRIKIVGLWGQLFLTLGLFIFSVMESLAVGICAFFVIGLGGGLIEIVVNTVISEIYVDRRTSAMNLLHGFFGVGALLGPVFMGYLIECGFGWRLGYQIIALFSALTLILQLTTSYPEKVSSDRIDFSVFFRIAKNPYTLLLGAITLLYVGAEMGINYWSVLYMETGLKIPKITASSFLTSFWIAMTLGRFVCFVAARKIGARKLLVILSVLSFFAFGVFLFVDDAAVAGGSMVVLGLAFSGIFPTIMGLGSDRFSDSLGTITGLIMTYMGCGMLLFPWLIGEISDLFSLNTGMFTILFITLLLMFLTGLLRLKRLGQS